MAADQTMQLVPQLPEALDSLLSSWQFETLIHGDMRWENCLVRTDRDTIHFVDWELANLGDGAWDVAGILHSSLVWSPVLRPASLGPPDSARLGAFQASRRARSASRESTLPTTTSLKN